MNGFVSVNGFRRITKEKRSSEPATAPIATNIMDESVKETPGYGYKLQILDI